MSRKLVMKTLAITKRNSIDISVVFCYGFIPWIVVTTQWNICDSISLPFILLHKKSFINESKLFDEVLFQKHILYSLGTLFIYCLLYNFNVFNIKYHFYKSVCKSLINHHKCQDDLLDVYKYAFEISQRLKINTLGRIILDVYTSSNKKIPNALLNVSFDKFVNVDIGDVKKPKKKTNISANLDT